MSLDLRDFRGLMGPVATRLMGEPTLPHMTAPRYGTRGSLAIDLLKGTWFDHEQKVGGGVLDFIERKTGLTGGDRIAWLKQNGFAREEERHPGNGARQPTQPKTSSIKRTIVATYDYVDETGELLMQVVRYEPRHFLQRRPDGAGDWIWNISGVRLVPYRLPALLEAIANDHPVFIVEGEKDCDNLAAIGVVATTNPMGAKKWLESFGEYFRGADVILIPDNDETGRNHVADVAAKLAPVAGQIRVLELPGMPAKGDASDWLAAGGTAEQLYSLAGDVRRAREKRASDEWTEPPNATPAGLGTPESIAGVALEDFVAYMPAHSYIFKPSGEMWPAGSVNARIAPIASADGKTISASTWLDRNASVEQMTWAPGEPMLIRDRLISDGGWFGRPGCSVFNLYRPPTVTKRPGNAAPWLDHVRRVFPDDADHIIKWLAHRVQRPQEKINHALVFGGIQGIGKDTILEPVKQAIGSWNFTEVSPQHMLGRFNGFVKSVILRVSEARDLGDTDRFAFYDHLKAYTAAPPDVLRVDEKFLREHAVLNVCGVIITSNHKADGIFLPADDRRHYVAWSDVTKESFDPAYWTRLYRWFATGGNEIVADHLAQLDLSRFDAKAPPPKTAAFWEIVNSNCAPENSEIADALDKLDWPAAVTLLTIKHVCDEAFADWLGDRKNSRKIPHRMEECGYTPVRNRDADDGLWKIRGRRQAVYAKRDLSPKNREAEAVALTNG